MHCPVLPVTGDVATPRHAGAASLGRSCVSAAQVQWKHEGWVGGAELFLCQGTGSLQRDIPALAAHPGLRTLHPGPGLLLEACRDEKFWCGGLAWPWAVGTALILPVLPIPQICSLMRGGIAERGGIRVGHRIIEINGQSVVATPHEKIIQILTQAVSEVSLAWAA